jgi:hypothetical protein
MSEIDNPTKETIYQTSCPKNEVCKEENPSLENTRFERIPQAPNLMGFYNGSSNLTLDEKRKKTQAERKLRSKNHFANEILPTLPKVDRLQYKRKWHKEGFKPKLNKNSK